MKSINDFVQKSSRDGHHLVRTYESLKKVVFTSQEYPSKIVMDYADERKEQPRYDSHESRLILPISICNGKVVINIISEKCEPVTVYKTKEQ